MVCKYFTLCTRDNGKWSPQFGDYDRAVVAQEADDTYWKANGGDYHRKDMKIITTGPKQSDIDFAIMVLNHREDATALREDRA